MYNVYKYGLNYPIACYESSESAESLVASDSSFYMLYEPEEDINEFEADVYEIDDKFDLISSNTFKMEDY